VSPFYIFHLLNDEGRSFFIDYYQHDINKALKDTEHRLDSAKLKVKECQAAVDMIKQQIHALQPKVIP